MLIFWEWGHNVHEIELTLCDAWTSIVQCPLLLLHFSFYEWHNQQLNQQQQQQVHSTQSHLWWLLKVSECWRTRGNRRVSLCCLHSPAKHDSIEIEDYNWTDIDWMWWMSTFTARVRPNGFFIGRIEEYLVGVSFANDALYASDSDLDFILECTPCDLRAIR